MERNKEDGDGRIRTAENNCGWVKVKTQLSMLRKTNEAERQWGQKERVERWGGGGIHEWPAWGCSIEISDGCADVLLLGCNLMKWQCVAEGEERRGKARGVNKWWKRCAGRRREQQPEDCLIRRMSVSTEPLLRYTHTHSYTCIYTQNTHTYMHMHWCCLDMHFRCSYLPLAKLLRCIYTLCLF